jgi:hypothetical protein
MCKGRLARGEKPLMRAQAPKEMTEQSFDACLTENLKK